MHISKLNLMDCGGHVSHCAEQYKGRKPFPQMTEIIRVVMGQRHAARRIAIKNKVNH